MASPSEFDEPNAAPPWYIGLHDSALMLPVTDEESQNVANEGHKLVQLAGYNMTTCPITTPAFHNKVKKLVQDHVAAGSQSSSDDSGKLPSPIVPALTPDDSVLVPYESISQLLSLTSSWIDLASADPVIVDVSRQVFNLEIAYAAFVGLSQVVVHGPVLPDGSISVDGVTQFARAIREAFSISPYVHVHVLLPMIPVKATNTLISTVEGSNTLTANFADGDVESATSQDSWASWEAWHLIRSICSYSTRLSVGLVVPKHIPPSSIQARWFSEPVSLLMFGKSAFVPNKYKQPVLHKNQQTLLYRFMRLKSAPWIIFNDISTVSQQGQSLLNSLNTSSTTDPTPSEAADHAQRQLNSVTSDPTPHLSYFRALQRKEAPRPPIEKFGAGYQDYLQMPLQPLADNLESVTYEVFEKDPIKYEWYERAIAFALSDWQELSKPCSYPSEEPRVVIAVAGSGRGPLVSRALAAADAVGVDVDVWAVEKNPNAYVLLQRYNKEKWNGRVMVVKTDMRYWNGPIADDGTPYRVDILVSELLGSFADNELSPECLDGVQHVLSANGISIPSSYAALLTPIATPRLHADLLHRSKGMTSDGVSPFDLPYVVMLHQYDFLSYKKQVTTNTESNDPNDIPEPALALKTPNILPCWTFDHPQPSALLQQCQIRKGGSAQGGGGGPTGGDGANAHNNRFCRLTFLCPRRGTCHGFAGYFETTLYESEKRSPENDSDEEEWDGDDDEDEVKVELSTNPLTMEKMSKDMISWFPIYFPLKSPISFPDNSELVISMWRQTDDRKVWYEWLVESFLSLPDGPRVRLGSTELQSSMENGCLM